MFTGTFWDFLLWLFWFYILFACISIFITIIVDLFRDHTLNGWGKALWVIFLVVLPFLGALIYLIARGQGMAQRELERRGQAQNEANSYIRDVAGTSSPANEIESAKKLLDSGAITQTEYDALKARLSPRKALCTGRRTANWGESRKSMVAALAPAFRWIRR